MDHRSFDRLARLLGGTMTRRAGVGMALGALTGLPEADALAGAHRHHANGGHGRTRRPKPEGPCGDHSGKDNRCKKDKECCTGYCKLAKAKSGVEGKKATVGRCRCIKVGKPCVSGQTCCGGATCASGTCAFGPGPVECSAATCPNGCCLAGVCQQGTDSVICGTGGAACASCSTYPNALCVAQVCAPGTWENWTTFGSSGSGASNFSGPYQAAVSADGLTIYVIDDFNNRVSIWTRPDAASIAWSNQTTFGTFGSGPSNFTYPGGIAVSANGLIICVSDSSNNRMSIWTRPDAASTLWSNQATFGTQGSGPSNFSGPTSVFVAPDGLTVYVVDSGNNRISIWTRPDAASTLWSNQTTFGTQGSGPSNFDSPTGLFVAADGLTIWVADSSNGRISIWTRPDAASTTWSNQTTFGTAGSGPSNFYGLAGVAASADGLTTYVADTNNNRISIWTRPDAASTTWTNQTTFGTTGSGPSNFTSPWNMAVSADGLIAYVADFLNNRISIWHYV